MTVEQAPEAELFGNEAVRNGLARLEDAGQLHPCLLFEGPAGLGKARVARWLAMRANCAGAQQDGLPGLAPAVARPCGTCWSCRQIAKGQHMDVIEIGLDPQRTAPVISARQARELLDTLRVHPYNARWRVVIIDPAEAMTPAAANALLKTLEEPPTSTGFILVTAHAPRLLPTVRSRAQRVRFAPIPASELAEWLSARGFEDAGRLAHLADGCPGRALALAEGELEEWTGARDALLGALSGEMVDLLGLAERLAKGDRSRWVPRVDRTLDCAERILGDALVVVAHSDTDAPAPRFNPDRPETVGRWARALGYSGVVRMSAAIQRARTDLEANVNPRLVADTLLCRMATELGPEGRGLAARTG